jgi:hypothetical protein
MDRADNIVSCMNRRFDCLLLVQAIIPRDKLMHNGAWAVFDVCPRVFRPNQVIIPAIHENNLFSDSLVLASMFNLVIMTLPCMRSEFCPATDSQPSSFLHMTNFAALLVFVVDEDQGYCEFRACSLCRVDFPCLCFCMTESVPVPEVLALLSTFSCWFQCSKKQFSLLFIEPESISLLLKQSLRGGALACIFVAPNHVTHSETE